MLNNIFRRLWCLLLGGHDWHVEDGQDLLQPGIPWFRCSRCGKRENTV